jgi:hypothetical protein
LPVFIEANSTDPPVADKVLRITQVVRLSRESFVFMSDRIRKEHAFLAGFASFLTNVETFI